MTLLFRVGLALAATVALVACTYPNGLSAAVRDLRDYAALTGEMSELSQHDADMTVRSAELMERVAAKEVIVKELVASRMSLDGATARFLALNGDDPEARRFLNSRYDGSTLEEKVARNVIDHASANLHLQKSGRTPGRDAPILASLDRQFRERYGHSR